MGVRGLIYRDRHRGVTCLAASINIYLNSSDCAMAAEQVHVSSTPPGFTNDIASALILVYLDLACHSYSLFELMGRVRESCWACERVG